MAERRRDLEMLPVQYPEKFIGSRLFPKINVQERSGKIFYRAITVDKTPVKGRAKGASLTKTLLTDENLDYAVVSTEERYAAPKEYYKQWGQEATDKAGGKASKRSVIRSLENDYAEVILGGTPNLDVGDKFFQSVIDAKKNLRRIRGRVAFVCSEVVFHRIMNYSEIQERLKYTGVIAESGMVIRGLKPSILQEILDVDEILIGDDEIWHDGNVLFADRAALVKIPEMEVDFPDLIVDPHFAIKLQTIPGEENSEFEVEYYYDDDDKTHCYDATAYTDLKILNSEGLYLFEGIDDALQA